MAFKHGKDTEITVDSDDLTDFSNTSQFDEESDEHDVTTYGRDDYVVQGGLKKGAFTMGGVYDDGVAGPAAVLRPLVGTVVTVVRKPLGTGTGKPTQTFSALVKKYTETNPVAGMITWQCDFTKSGPMVPTTQS